MRPRRSASLVVAIATAIAVATPALGPRTSRAAATPDLVVDTFVDEADGSCADGDCSLRDAVAAAAASDVIEVPPGYYALTLAEAGGASDGTIDLARHVTIRGRGDSGTFLDGGALGASTFSVSSDAVARLAQVTVFGAAGPIGGAGAFDVVAGRLVLDRVTVVGGHGVDAGAVLVRDAGHVTARRSSFVGNRSPSGAGALDVRGSARLTASTLARNRGAVGGAIDVRGGASVALSNTTLSGNRAAGLGGAIHVGAGVAVLANATVAGNRAGAGGGGIALGTGGVLEAARSIVAANASDVGPADCAGRVTSLGRNVSSGRACGFDRPSDRVGVDPRLRPLRSYGGPTETRALRPGSPAIDVGGDCGAADQRGAPRRGACDAGAYELVRCLGRPVDIVGTGEDDELSGGREPDTFLGRAGDDGFQGSLDEDRGCGARGGDHLIGGPGGDRLAGGVGGDRIEGEGGPDRLLGGPGADVLIGGPGRDVCVTDRRDRAVGCEVERRRA